MTDIQKAESDTDVTSSNPLVFKTKFHRHREGCELKLRKGPAPRKRKPHMKPARLAIMLGLAHKIEQAIREGKLKDRAEAAVRLGLTRARITQLCDLTLLPVEAQERVLFMEAADGVEPVTERGLRI
jgi:hypothetical protein